MKIKITESGLRRIVEDEFNKTYENGLSIVNGICDALYRNGIEVNDGSNEIQGLEVNGREYDLYFDADIEYSMTSRGSEMTYDYPGEAPQYDYYIVLVRNIEVYDEDGPIEELRDNEQIKNAIMKYSSIDESSVDVDEYDAKHFNESIDRGHFNDKYEYATDIIDSYYNMMDDGNILSGDQLRQVGEIVKWLEEHNANDNPHHDKWVKMGYDILDRFNGRGSGLSYPVDEIFRRTAAALIAEGLTEDRTVSDDGTVEIDNFDRIKQLMDYKADGDTLYFVEIMRRKKDNPYMGGSRDFVKQYYFKSMQEFESSEDEIKSICQRHNARAYIYINARSAAMVDKWTSINMSRFKRHPSMGDKYQWNAKSLAAGRSLDEPDRPLCFVDIDSSDMNDIKTAMKIIRDAGIKPLYAYRSINNGLHIILPNKDDAKKLDFSPINGNLNGLSQFAKNNAKVSVEIDKPVLLYASLIPNGYGKQYARFQKLAGRKI